MLFYVLWRCLAHLPGDRDHDLPDHWRDLEKAKLLTEQEIPRTTKLYDRRNDVVSLDEVEKVVF